MLFIWSDNLIINWHTYLIDVGNILLVVMQCNAILIYLDIVPVIVFVIFQDTFGSTAFRLWRLKKPGFDADTIRNVYWHRTRESVEL